MVILNFSVNNCEAIRIEIHLQLPFQILRKKDYTSRKRMNQQDKLDYI